MPLTPLEDPRRGPPAGSAGQEALQRAGSTQEHPASPRCLGTLGTGTAAPPCASPQHKQGRFESRVGRGAGGHYPFKRKICNPSEFLLSDRREKPQVPPSLHFIKYSSSGSPRLEAGAAGGCSGREAPWAPEAALPRCCCCCWPASTVLFVQDPRVEVSLRPTTLLPERRGTGVRSAVEAQGRARGWLGWEGRGPSVSTPGCPPGGRGAVWFWAGCLQPVPLEDELLGLLGRAAVPRVSRGAARPCPAGCFPKGAGWDGARVCGWDGARVCQWCCRWVRRELSSFTRARFTSWLCSVCLSVRPVRRGGRRPQRGARGLPCATGSERMALGTPQHGGSSRWGAGGVGGHEGQQGPWRGPATPGMSPPNVPKSGEQPWGTSLCRPRSLPGEQVASQDSLLSLQACSFFPSCTKILGCLAS